MKLKNVLKYGVAAAALSMVLLCAPAAYAEGPEAEAAPADPAVAAESAEDENALFTGMHLSQSSMTLTVRSSNQNPSSSLSVRRTDEEYSSVRWTSSNGSVASVDSYGTVTARGVGYATITATTNKGESATCRVTVERAAAELDHSYLCLNITYDNAHPTSQLNLQDSYYGSSYERWSSSNTNVVTVSDGGMVTAQGVGTATVTARTSNGESASCRVTVSNSVGDVSVSQTVLLMPDVGSVQQLSATIAAAGGEGMARTWVSMNPAVATVSESGYVTAVGNGETKIIVSSPDGKYAGCTCYVGDAARQYQSQQQMQAALGVVVLVVVAGVIILVMMGGAA